MLDLVIEAARPITLHFERRGNPAAAAQGNAEGGGAAAPRVQHAEWKRPEVVTCAP